MGFVGSLFGGNSGTNFQAQKANLQKPTTNQQATDAYTQSQNALQQQQAFLNALQGQGGIQNQQNVFNQQQQLTGQLQGIANGTGPNPALAQLHQATGQNIANQAALMASQRGSGANAGLIARQAGQQGGSLQQQAVGQGATLQAQQQLAGLQALQAQQGMMGNLATQQVGQQGNALGSLNQLSQNEQGTLLNSINAQNNAEVSNTSQANQANSQIAQTQAKGQFGLLNSVGGALGLFASGGLVKDDDFYRFGDSEPKHQSKVGSILSAPINILGQGLGAIKDAALGSINKDLVPIGHNYQGQNPEQNQAPLPNGQMYAAHGGYVPAMVSPGERYLPPKEVKEVAKGKNPMKVGEKIPGKSHVKGDSLKNDTVSKKLKEGGIVLPKSVTEHPSAPDEAKRFVQAILAKNKMRTK